MADKVAKGFKGLAIFNLVVAIVFALLWVFATGWLGTTTLYIAIVALAAINAILLWGSGEKVEHDTVYEERRETGVRTYHDPHDHDDPTTPPYGGTHTDY